jgi:hypothetical protein
MPQIEGGPKGLNEILHATYTSALSQSKDKAYASKVAWAAAKDEYRRKGGKWVSKMYEDLGTLIIALDKVVSKTDAPDYEYLLYPIQQLSKDAKGIEEETPVEQLAIEEVLVNPYNREVDRNKVDNIKQAIQETSSIKPSVYSEVDNDGKKGKMIIDGHHRYLALKELGYMSIPARLANSRGTKTSDNDLPVTLTKADVVGLELVREDLQGAPKKGTNKLPEAETVEKGGPGSGRHPDDAVTHTDNLQDQLRQVKDDFKTGKITPIEFKQRAEPIYAKIQRTGHFSGQTVKPVPPINKGGPGSGCTGDNCGRPSTGETSKPEKEPGLAFLSGLRPAVKVGNKIHDGHMYETHADIYNRLLIDLPGDVESDENIDTGFVDSHGTWLSRKELYEKVGYNQSEQLAEAQEAALKFIKADIQKRQIERLQKGGPGSGRRYEGGPKEDDPSSGHKAFAEPFHSPKHVKQFLSSTDVVLASVNRADLSPEKNALRQQEFEGYLKASKIPYKKGIGVSKSWGNEESYMIHAPEKEQAAKLHDTLTRKYAQDAVIHVRNAHATMQFKDGKVMHANVNDLQGGNLTDDYTEMDGQRFKIPFK